MNHLVDLLNTFGAYLLRSMARLSVELVVLAAVVLAAVYLLRVRSPRLRHLFWCVVLAKPLATFLIASPFSLYWFLHPITVQPPPPVQRPVVMQTVTTVVDSVPRGSGYRPMPRPMPVRTLAPVPPWWAGLGANGVLAAFWMTGATLLTLRLVFGFAFVSFLRRTAVPQEQGMLAETADRARTMLGLRRRVPVALSPVVHGPVLAGVLRPAVLLPAHMIGLCTPQQVELVVAHEMAHARRMDNMALLLQRLAEVVLFFHPVVWLCGWVMRRESESACDYAVIAAYSAAARADRSALYADSLTRVAEMRSGITRRLLINTFAAAESNLRTRVRRIIEGRLTRRTLTWTFASVAALVMLAVIGLPTAARPAEQTPKKPAAQEKTMDRAVEGTRYGFRYDPMKYVETDASVPAALVRAQVFGTPKEGDDQIIAGYVNEILAKQREDGSFAEKSGDTGRSLTWLAVAGVGPERPEFMRGYQAMMRQREAEAIAGAPGDYGQEGLVLVPINGLRAACMTDLVRTPEVRRTVRWLADHPDLWLQKTCPWGATFVLRALYHAREVEDVDAGIDAALDWIGERMNDAGCVSYWDPYAVTAALGTIHTPKARALLLRQVPMLLRGQEAGGGWGQNKWDMQTLDVFRALKTHGLLDALRSRPPLPPDWRVVRSIPAPDGDLGWMTYQAGRLYVHNYKNGEIIAVAPENGSVTKRLQVLGVFPVGIGQWDGSLAVTQKDGAKRVLKVDPESGAIQAQMDIPFVADPMCATMVGDRLWVADGWLFPGWVVDPAHPENVPSSEQNADWDPAFRLESLQAGTCPNGIAATPDGVWQTDFFARVMIKSGPDGKLSDWAERPFDGWPPDIAYDGRRLWALDPANKRICVIEKTETAPEPKAGESAAAVPAAAVAAQAPQPDYSKLKLQCDNLTRDSFSVAVQAAARLLGRDVDYDTVYALSTNCFAPGVRPEEPCKTNWVLQARDRSMDLIGRYVGLSLAAPPNPEEMNEIPPSPDGPWGTSAKDAWLRDWYRKPLVPHVRRLIAGGSVIVSQGEWKQGIDGVAWCDWGIITRADDDGTIVGAGVNGRSDNPTDYVREGWLLSAGQPSISRRAADLEVLARAVHRIRGDAEPFLPDKHFVFGLRAMDEWIAQMEQPSFQPGCAADSRDSKENAYATGMTVYSGARASAAWLRDCADRLSGAARPRVGEAAARYDRITVLLRPAVTGQGGESYRQFIGDAAKQKAHANVLRQVKDELAAAADEMAAALGAEGVSLTAAPVRRVSLTDLKLKTPGAEMFVLPDGREPFGIVLQEAGRLLGRPMDYATLYALSAEGFAPTVTTWEDEMARVTWFGRGGDLDAVGERFGLRFERLQVEAVAPQARMAKYAALIRRRLDRGELLVVDGWMKAGPGWWGVVTDVDPDGTVLAASLNGRTDNVPEDIYACWSVTTAAPDADMHAADLRMLKLAVGRIRGADDDRVTLHGLRGMDYLAAAFENDDAFCPNCPDEGAGCARPCMTPVYNGFAATATYLRGRAASFPESSRAHVAAAADRYDRIVALLKPAVTGVGGESYDRFMPDRAKRRAHAAVVRQAKAELSAAADEMAAALAAEGVGVPQTNATSEGSIPMGAKVRREDGRVEIDGVPAMAWGRSCDTAFAGAMEAALAPTGQPYTATQIMGFSGLAFRVRWAGDPDNSKAGWCPSIPVGEFWEEQQAVAKATGWRFRIINEMEKEAEPKMGRYAGDIAAAIDAGLPVVGYPNISDLNPGVAVGYEGDGAERKFLWRTYWTGENAKPIAAADTGPWVMVPQGFGGAPDARQRLLDALSIAVRNWKRGLSPHPNGYPYAWGELALQYWQKDIGRAATFTEERQKGLFFVNWWNYEAFQDARTRAAAFLKDEAPNLGAEGRDAVLRAAALYEQEGKLLVAQIEKPEGFLGPWSGKGLKDWTPAVRAREQEILAQALDLERRAVAEIEAALKAEGMSAPAPAESGRSLSDDDVRRLGQWQNVFGGARDKLLLGAERYPETLRLLETEKSLEPIAANARAIRKAMGGLEPAEWDYAGQLEEILTAIGSGAAPAGRDDTVRERLAYVEERRQALLHWLAGMPQSEAEGAGDTDAATARLTYSLLGAPDADKRRLAQMVADKLGPDGMKPEDLAKLEASESLAPFAHRIDMHGYQLWSFDSNHELLLRSIGQGRALGEWHKPGGPLAWGDGDPADRPRVEAMLDRLEKWLVGGADATLGAPDAYKEKVWLARSLALYLRDHRDNYYGWNAAATTPAGVRREDGKVWIEGMEGVNWGGSFFAREDSQARCLVEALRCAGQDVDYADVMGLSGAAFKITMAPNLSVEQIHSEMGMDWLEIVSRVWGVDYDWQAISMSDKENPNWRVQLREAAAESIGRGVPLFYMNGEWNLLVGYREDGSAFVCKPYAGENPVYTESKVPGGFLGDAWFASVLRPAGQPADRRDSVLRSLRSAVELATHPAKADGSRLFGFAAYEAWIAALETDRKDASKHGNAFSYSQLLTSRRAGAEYLRKVADELGGDAAPHLRTAADRYEAVAKRLDSGRDCVKWPWEENWTAENRATEAGILRRCLADEKVAVSEIAAALAALGETVPAPATDAGGAVLLQDAVADFKHIADDVAGHRAEALARGATEDFYPQPYCRLTTMLVQMHAAGWKEMDFDTLAAVSGASAMFGYEPNEFMPKYAWHWRDPNALVAQATGYATEAVRATTAEDAYEFLKESVRSGRPVSAWEGEMMLLAGYQDAAAAADRKVFAMKDGNGYYAEWWDWDRFAKWVGGGRDLWRHSGRVEPKPAKEVALRVMGDLVALSAGVPQGIQSGFPKATFGLAGIEAWAADCADIEKHEDWGMCHPENPQWTVRNSTAAYLENVAKQGLLSPDATAHVRKAAARYRSAYAAWQQAYGLIGYAAPEGSGKVVERRLAAAAAVRRAAEYEKAGIGELGAALKAEGVGAQPASAVAGEVVLDIPGMPEDLLDKGLADRGCSYQAGVARAYVYALRQAGVDIDFTEFTALSGWAFSFVYNYGNCPQVGIRVRGTAGGKGPGETFQIADWFGLAYESAPTRDREKFWTFVKDQIGAGRPIISEHGDGGLILGHREHDGKREVRFASFMGGRWMDINGFEPFEVCALVPRGQALPKRDLYLKGLQRAVNYATMPEWKGAVTGLAGLDTYAADVADPAKDFANHSDWFCWATFNRIDARVCAADWLREAADVLGGDARRPLLAAADQYARAFKSYSEFQAGLGGGDDSAQAFLERVRTPEKVAALAPLLKAGVEAERAGVAELKLALVALNAAPPDSGAGTPPSGGAARAAHGTGEVQVDGVSLAECHSPDGNWGASLPRAMAVALKHAGREISFSDMAAGSGWAFSFGYNYRNWHVAALSVGQFDWLPEQLGYRFDSVGFADRDEAWQFITSHLDAGTVVVTTLVDGGLITAYREQDGKREFLFDGEPSRGWHDVNSAHRLDRCAAAVKSGEPKDRAQIARDSLPRALKAAKQAQGALDAYLVDVQDPAKDFDGLSEWFCWATFERLSSRGCCAAWLRNAADLIGGDAGVPLLAAAEGYERAYTKYSEYDALVHAEEGSGKTLQEQVRTPEKIAALVPVLQAGIQAERAAVAQFEAAVRALGEQVPAVTASAAAAGPTREDGKVWLDGLKRFPSWMDEPGCLVACSRYLGLESSPDWVYGSTGFAFALNVHRVLCPSGPTAWGDENCAGLARNVGMRVEGMFAGKDGGNLAQKQEEFFGRVSRAIDAGLPVIGWEMDQPDYYVVHGYDADGNYLFRNFDDSVGRVSKRKLGDTGIGVLSLMIVHPQAPADDRMTVGQALALALDMAAGKPHHGAEYAMGLAGYDQWIKALAEPEAVLADDVAAFGLGYNAACWAECRSHAPGFLQEAQKRLSDPSLDADFAAAIASYRKVAAGMSKVQDLFPFEPAQGARMTERLRDAALRAQALEALRSARAAEAEGLRSLAALLEKLGGPRVDVAATVGPRRVVLESVPAVGGDGNGYVRGIEVLLAGAGTPVAYERLMGLSGMAFIAQADTEHRWEGKVDVGWWPLDMWGLEMRREFLARSVGWELREVGLQAMDLTEEQVKATSADLPKFYRDHLERHVRASIDAGRPVLGSDDFGFVITGYDDATDAPPVFGRCPRLADSEIGRAESWPCGLIMLGARTEPTDADAADVAALQYAVALASDQAGPTDPRWRNRRFTGRKAFAAWAALLRNADEPVEDRHHANMIGNLRMNRTAAVSYLRAVAGRQEGEATAALGDAAASYEAALTQLSQMKWSGLAASMEARRTLADQVDRLAATELEAAGHIRRALQALGKEVAVTAAGPAPVITGNKHMLAGLECVPMTCAELSAVGGALKYLGRDVSNAWLYGATGHAFAINMRPTVCVSSPYAWRKTLYELAPNIGCRITGLKIQKQAAGDTFPARQREAWDMVRAAVDRGLPCYADRISWMPDYSLITGYDDVGYYYTHANAGARGGPTPWQKLGTEDIEVLDVWRVELCEPKPDDEVVKAALSTVLQHAATPDGWTVMEGQRSGPWAFDLWADELEAGHAVLDNHTYNAHFWWEARAMAVDFLKEAKRRLPGRADAAFDEAIASYTVVRDKLAAVKDLSPFRNNSDWKELLKSPEQAALIREAGAAERRGLAALAKVLVAIGETPPAVSAAEGEGGGEPKVVPRRFVLRNVRKVAEHTDKWRFTPFCNALSAALEYLGEPEQYDYLMCTSGAAFRMRWAAKAWDGGNSDILGMASETLEPMRRAFRSAGYQMQAVGKEKTANWAEDLIASEAHRLGGELTDEAGFRRAIIGSINAGRPVIAFGVIGPPEACVVTGYDERGDVLLGWNIFQDGQKTETESSGYFRVRDWYGKTRGLLLIGDKVGKPDQMELDLGTLKWALQVLRTPVVGGSSAGPAAFDAWAADMLNDEYFPKGNDSVLHARLMCHWDSMTVTAFRGGNSVTPYLTAAAGRQPLMAAELLAAARCLENEDVVHGVAPGEEAQIARLADPAVRRKVADSILHARDMHAEAADHIEKALLAAGVPQADIPPVQAATAAPEAPSGKTMLAGLKFPKWTITQLGCMSACMDYLGRSVPRPWLYGGTAHAFFISIHDDVDLESVTAWDQDWMLKLTPNLGFLTEGHRAVKPEMTEDAWRAVQDQAWQFVRRSILLNRPCYGWELKAPYGDYWLITGFDDTGYYYDGWETGGPTPWRKLGEQFIPVLMVRSVQPCEPAKDQVVVRDALVAAVAHAQPGWDKSADSDAHFGPEAFDAWAKALESGAAKRNHHAYNAIAWHECREMAVDFLKEVKRRIPGRADEPLDRAIASYTISRDRLAALKALTPIDDKLGWGDEPKLQSAEAAKLVREAGAAEREGLKALAQVAIAFGADPKAVAVGAGASMPRIETKRLVLRAFTADDWRDFQELAVDWAAAPGPAFDKWRTSEEACRESVEYMSTRDRWFAVSLRDTGKVIGLLGINGISDEKQADVAHVILSRHQDDDLDREALQAVIQYCFDARGAQSVITHNASEHTAQLAPLKSLGFVNTDSKDPGELTITKARWEGRDRGR